MAEHSVSLACSTYQTGKLLLFGRKPDGDSVGLRAEFQAKHGIMGRRPDLMDELAISALAAGEPAPSRRFLPRPRPAVRAQGGCHDRGPRHPRCRRRIERPTSLRRHRLQLRGDRGRTLQLRAALAAVVRDAFAAEDRCHLNGLALEDGRCKYVTTVAQTDRAGAWREHRRDGGAILQVPSGNAVASGLSMPHSPRLHRGELWVLNSGTGFLGTIDRDRGRLEPVAFCPGYLRGLSFVGDHFAVVTLSRPRHDETFGDLELDETLVRYHEPARCGLLVIDLCRGPKTPKPQNPKTPLNFI